MMNSNKRQQILALRDEGKYFASYDEIQRCIAEDWGVCTDPESGISVVSVISGVLFN